MEQDEYGNIIFEHLHKGYETGGAIEFTDCEWAGGGKQPAPAEAGGAAATAGSCDEQLPRLEEIVAEMEADPLRDLTAADFAAEQSVVDTFVELVNALERQVEEETSGVAAYCREAIGWPSAAERLPEVRNIRNKVSAALAGAIRGHAVACESTDATEAQQAALQATSAAQEAQRLANGLEPEEYQDRLELGEVDDYDIRMQWEEVRTAVENASYRITAAKGRHSMFLNGLGRVDPILEACEGRPSDGSLGELRSRVAVLQLIASTEFSLAHATVSALSDERTAAWYRQKGLLKRQEAARACLASVPDFHTGFSDLRDLHTAGAADAHEASELARSAEQCAANLAAVLPDEASLPPVEIELTYPVGSSPRVFTVGWLFGARAMLVSPDGERTDLSDEVHWSGSGSFSPTVGSTSRPVFAAPGANTILLTVTIEGQVIQRQFAVEAVGPEGYAAVGDEGFNETEVHPGSLGSGVVTVRGPITTGSPTVTVRNLPAARVGDRGVHSLLSCQGSNTFEVVGGDSSVLIDGRPAARRGDTTRHCGGQGVIVPPTKPVTVEQLVDPLEWTPFSARAGELTEEELALAKVQSWSRQSLGDKTKAKSRYLRGLRQEQGDDSEADYATARELYRKGAERGYAKAQFRLGRMYENGLGSEIDLETALAWYRLAAAQGNREAELAVARMERAGR